MSASALVNPLSNLVHMHPRPAQLDTRVSVVLTNSTGLFRDVKIGGKVYTVEAHRILNVKAPTGTVIYAASRSITHRRGEAIVELKPELNERAISVD
jgi:hypothetical protein